MAYFTKQQIVVIIALAFYCKTTLSNPIETMSFSEITNPSAIKAIEKAIDQEIVSLEKERIETDKHFSHLSSKRKEHYAEIEKPTSRLPVGPDALTEKSQRVGAQVSLNNINDKFSSLNDQQMRIDEKIFFYGSLKSNIAIWSQPHECKGTPFEQIYDQIRNRAYLSLLQWHKTRLELIQLSVPSTPITEYDVKDLLPKLDGNSLWLNLTGQDLERIPPTPIVWTNEKIQSVNEALEIRSTVAQRFGLNLHLEHSKQLGKNFNSGALTHNKAVAQKTSQLEHSYNKSLSAIHWNDSQGLTQLTSRIRSACKAIRAQVGSGIVLDASHPKNSPAPEPVQTNPPKHH
jgi:hypothetical protein